MSDTERREESVDDGAVARAVAGDRDELERLLRACEPALRARIRIAPLWRRSLDADDVLQVSFLEAFLRIATLRDASAAGFRAWLERVVDHNLLDAVRGLERDKRPDARRRDTRGPRGESARTLLARMSATGSVDPAELEDEVARLHAAIERLPPSYRAVVRALDLEERDVEEVAQELGRSRGAVHLLRSRAHDRLGELLRG